MATTPRPKRYFGQQTVCTKCGHDIEWHGTAIGWLDRGAGLQCLPTGRTDQDGVALPTPTGKHTDR